MPCHALVFDEVIISQLKKIGEDRHLRDILSRMFDKMEELGPRAGTLIDSRLFLYEIKSKHPPIRMYYRHIKQTDEVYVFEFEMKTSPKKQERTIWRLKRTAGLKSQDQTE